MSKLHAATRLLIENGRLITYLIDSVLVRDTLSFASEVILRRIFERAPSLRKWIPIRNQ